jgi:hypothetical protein
MAPITTNWYEKAEQRINKNKRLQEFRKVFLYDWNDPEHYEWVATAKISELLDWAAAVDVTEIDPSLLD